MAPRRTTTAAAVAALLVLSLAACSGSDSGSGEEEQGASGPTDMTMTVWTADEDVIGLYESLADDFREGNPELGEFTVQSIPFANYTGRLTTQLSGGDAPDIGWLVEADIPALAEAGVLSDVGGALRDDEDYNFDDILPNTLSQLERDQGLFGYPFANTTQPIIFNVDLFAAAGVDNPIELLERGEWTWENLARISRELVASGEAAHGFNIPQFQYQQYQLLTPFLKAFGAEAWPGGTECGYASPESLEALEFLRTMIFADDSFPAPGESANFATGDTGMILGPPSGLNELTDAGFAFDLVPQPEGVNGFDPFFGQAALVVFANGQNPELAAELLKHFSTEDASRQFTRFFIPPRQALLTPEIVAEVNPLLTPEAAARSMVDTLPEAEQIEYPTVLPELNSAIVPVMDGLWTADADTEAIATEACEVAAPLLGSA